MSKFMKAHDFTNAKTRHGDLAPRYIVPMDNVSEYSVLRDNSQGASQAVQEKGVRRPRLVTAGSVAMLVRSGRTVTALSKNPYVRVEQFGAIDFDVELMLSNDSFEKDVQIFGEGDPSENVYQVVTGAVRCCKLLSDGRCQITAFHLPGDIFGFDLSAAHPTSAEAIVDTTLRVAKRRHLQQAAETNAVVGHELWCLTARKLKHAEDHLLLLGRKTALERVAAFLVEMDGRLNGNGNLPLPMRRRDIGDYLGLTLETVSRVLSALHDEGIIGFSGDARHIVLRNRNRLRTMELSTELN